MARIWIDRSNEDVLRNDMLNINVTEFSLSETFLRILSAAQDT